ncbi:MAG TPA: von Willebrand factor type A domain-containing protein [Thermoanaerobaculia bacterium]|nr:von Willebrand factor type A domain-containing protein [Thermoanaerobaculia bacterium]
MRKRIAAFFFTLIAIACSSQRAHVTSTVALPNAAGSTISGAVFLGGAPLPGVTVTISGPIQGPRTVFTDANGEYHIALLPAGKYVLQFEMESMQTVTQRVKIPSQKSVGLATEMKLSSVAETITVTAEAPSFVSGGAAYRSRQAVMQTTEPQSTARYASIDEHKFTKTRDEATTTFAIDVDRASYTNVRRMLSAGQMPPPGAVRIEEMVNYFTYHYPQPADARPFSVTSEVAGCPWNLNHRILRVGIQGRNTEEWQMAPNNLVFLLDVSGSMEPPMRLPLIKSGFRLLIDRLRPQDKVSIVTYAGAAGLALPATSGADKATILAALDNLQAGGSTAGGEGIELAYKVAQDNFIQGGNNRVILATDGDFNVGITSEKELEALITEKREHGVFLTTIGVGDDNYQDATMELLADKGNGMYAYLDKLDEARKVFEKELTGTLVTIAKDVKVQLEFDPSRVAEYRQIGYEDRALTNADFADDKKDAGDLGAGHSVTALYELVPVSGGNIGTLRLRYKEPTGSSSSLIETPINDDGTSAYAASPDMQFALAVAELGMLLRKSPYAGNATYADVLALARQSRGEDLEGYREELIRLTETSRGLSGEAAPSVAGR